MGTDFNTDGLLFLGDKSYEMIGKIPEVDITPSIEDASEKVFSAFNDLCGTISIKLWGFGLTNKQQHLMKHGKYRVRKKWRHIGRRRLYKFMGGQ